MRVFHRLLVAALMLPALALAQTPIKVGIANDLSGPFAALGAEARDGFTSLSNNWEISLAVILLSFYKPIWAATLIRPSSL